jgi:hypothetical protein
MHYKLFLENYCKYLKLDDTPRVAAGNHVNNSCALKKRPFKGTIEPINLVSSNGDFMTNYSVLEMWKIRHMSYYSFPLSCKHEVKK